MYIELILNPDSTKIIIAALLTVILILWLSLNPWMEVGYKIGFGLITFSPVLYRQFTGHIFRTVSLLPAIITLVFISPLFSIPTDVTLKVILSIAAAILVVLGGRSSKHIL